MVTAEQVIADYTKIVLADVRELQAAGHFSDGPYTRSTRFQAFVHLDVSPAR